MSDTLKKLDSNGEIMEVDIVTGEILESPEHLPVVKLPSLPYDLETADIILNLVSSGASLAAIERQLLLQKNQISRWLRTHPDFKQKYLEARSLRAYTFEDKMVDIIEDPTLRDEDLKVADFKFKGYAKLASFGNKSEFGTKHVETTHSGGVNLIIETGIRRGYDEKEKEINERYSDDATGEAKRDVGELSWDKSSENGKGTGSGS